MPFPWIKVWRARLLLWFKFHWRWSIAVVFGTSSLSTGQIKLRTQTALHSLSATFWFLWPTQVAFQMTVSGRNLEFLCHENLSRKHSGYLSVIGGCSWRFGTGTEYFPGTLIPLRFRGWVYLIVWLTQATVNRMSFRFWNFVYKSCKITDGFFSIQLHRKLNPQFSIH